MLQFAIESRHKFFIYISMISFEKYNFHPVINIPSKYEVYDFSKSYDPNRKLNTEFGIGKYNEKRPSMYTSQIYQSDNRDNHIGIDIAAPIGTEIYSFWDAKLYLQKYNSADLDYGYTIICEYHLDGVYLYALYGHLSKSSHELHKEGQMIKKGEIIGFIGDKSENGGWNPHLHFQLSYLKPEICDMPGVVSDKDLKQALLDYPDPQLILGKLY